MRANNFPRKVHSTYTFVCMTARYKFIFAFEYKEINALG